MYSDRINLGVEWLDKVRPDWFDSIDLDRLDISCIDNCVLGQVFGEFGNAPLLEEEIYELGFDINSGPDRKEQVKILQSEWEDKIRELAG